MDDAGIHWKEATLAGGSLNVKARLPSCTVTSAELLSLFESMRPLEESGFKKATLDTAPKDAVELIR